MTYTEYGLRIDLKTLRTMLERAENEAQYHDKESCIYIKGGDKPRIKQYSVYAECNGVNHTCTARDERRAAV